ncbi:ectonucleotide pyrophosphatase/phosphodiesterase [Marinilongibacter aquaticus]|uniref:alkaline phosphatase family protein n=1 Tax=Marinilongibacter aquaticus TaxID=2975157 RepID=UPI0021BDDA3B|nr:ectonucleotide pyrophosphatase/phosphodiesterase [Marinilongibacter aquaticus]UBM57579.1 ectonucleotide pyrophosphatase/phosphodiesterase [Marinilongibacter aquaticus]
MKPILTIAAVFVAFFAFSQEPSYEQVLDKEILSNAIENNEESLGKPYVIMVSIDGFRYDYAEKFQAQNMLDLAQSGSSAKWLIPSFPSKTFPNHYTLVTGLFPENHGIVSNSFYDKNQGKAYRIGEKNSVENGAWYGGVPLWNLAQIQGMCAASYFWVGSEADINGMHPKYYYRYEKTTPYEYRVRRVLEWLQMPEKVRPHMLTLYFSLVDTQGHKFGPDAEETKAAVLHVDQQIGALREGLKKLNLPVYLIVTADHGMDDVSEFINVRDYGVELERGQFYSGPVAMIYTKNEEETEAIYAKLAKQNLFKVYTRDAVPAYLHHNKNEKIGDLVLIADSPYTIIYSEKDLHKMEYPGGTHGYDPFENKNMGAIFYVEGPNVKKDFQISAIENIHVYPLVAHLLGLKTITPIDGSFEAISQILENEAH